MCRKYGYCAEVFPGVFRVIGAILAEIIEKKEISFSINK